MKAKPVVLLTVFAAVFALHLGYFVLSKTVFSAWLVTPGQTNLVARSYFEQQEYLLGASYGLSVAFVTYSFFKAAERRKDGLKGVVGGLSLVSVLYAAGCFLIGCCGSPMLVIYLGLFGPSFLALAKPLVATLTAVSVVLGYFWLRRGDHCLTCEPNRSCTGSTALSSGPDRQADTLRSGGH